MYGEPRISYARSSTLPLDVLYRTISYHAILLAFFQAITSLHPPVDAIKHLRSRFIASYTSEFNSKLSTSTSLLILQPDHADTLRHLTWTSYLPLTTSSPSRNYTHLHFQAGSSIVTKPRKVQVLHRTAAPTSTLASKQKQQPRVGPVALSSKRSSSNTSPNC